MSKALKRQHGNELAREARAKAIYDVGMKCKISSADVQKAIKEDMRVDQFKDFCLEELRKRNNNKPKLTEFSYLNGFSLQRYIAKKASGESIDGRDKYFLDQHKERHSGTPKEGGIFLPESILDPIPTRSQIAKAKRDLTASSDTAGGFTINDELAKYIQTLDPSTPIVNRVTRITSKAPYRLPSQESHATAEWTAEAGAASQQSQTFSTTLVSAHYLRAFTTVSRSLINQSSLDVEALIRSDLRSSINLGLESGIVMATGQSNQPTGLNSNTNINEITYRSGSFGYDDILECENTVLDSDVAVQNASGNQVSGESLNGRNYDDYFARLSMAWIVSPSVKRLMRQTPAFVGASTPLWETGDIENDTITIRGQGSKDEPRVLDYPAFVSPFVTSGQAYFGAFNELLLTTFSPGAELVIDPYTLSTRNLVRISVHLAATFTLRHNEAIVRLKA